jgi:hypothetical protein
MRKGIVATVALGMLAVTVLGQDAERRRGDRERRGDRRGRGPSINQMVDRMAEELKFDEEQMAQIEEIVAAAEQRQQDQRAQWREVRTAMEEGDEERAAELREQLRREGGGRGAAMQTVFNEIEMLLHEDQFEAFDQMRERMSQRRGRGGRDMTRRMVRELPDAVQMTEEQREEFQALLEERRAMMRERMQERRQRDDGVDAERGERGERRGPPDFAAMSDELFEQVAEILNEDQLELLAEYRARVESERRGRGSRESDDLQTVLSAARRIRGLDSDQKDAVREIERDAMRLSRELRREDTEGRALLAAEVKAKIARLLDEEQAEEFERNLERLKSRGSRGQRERGEPRERRERRERDVEPERP